jgi:aspartate carbamoyltransferase catalytic subunit
MFFNLKNGGRKMRLSHIIEAQQFSREFLEDELFPLADEMRKVVQSGGSQDLAGKKMISFFEEPSTRTHVSFQMAMYWLGGSVAYSTENAIEFSSRAKGEILEDTFRILSLYKPDVIVYRSKEEGMAKIAAESSSVPIINAGDGIGQHPTQALLDVYTINRERGKVDGTSIALVGDLARGRTARSLVYLLGKFAGIKMFFVSPELVKMGDDIKDYLARHNIRFEESRDLHAVAPLADVIYQTRIQKERGDVLLRYEKEHGFYKVDRDILNLMQKDAIIMHPLPRNDEISPEVDSDPRAAYFRQAENGLYIRMALLKMVLAG